MKVINKILLYLLLMALFGQLYNFISRDFDVWIALIWSLTALIVIEKKIKTEFRYSLLVSMGLAAIISKIEGNIGYALVYIILSYIFSFLFYLRLKFKQGNLFVLTILCAIYLLSANWVKDKLRDYQNYGQFNRMETHQLRHSNIAAYSDLTEREVLDINDTATCVVDFWSLGCPRCMYDIKVNLPPVKKKFSNVKFYSLCYSLRDTAKEWKRIRELSPFGKHYLLYDETEKLKFQIDGFPVYYIFKNGLQRYIGNADQLEKALMEINKSG